MTDNNLQWLASKTFSLQDQKQFADFCGDINPIHMDSVFARKTLYGQPIVHGVHTFLWALESLCDQRSLLICKAKVKFLEPIFLSETVDCFWDSRNRLIIKCGDVVVVRASVQLQTEFSPTGEIPVEQRGDAASMPKELTFAQASALPRQPLQIYGDPSHAQSLFPSLGCCYGVAAIAEIAACSYVVGMECPGMQSLFAALTFEFKSSEAEPSFEVVKSEERFGLLTVGITGRVIQANIEAFYRPMPTTSLHISAIAQRVTKDEFSSARALIIGGSRGIGEATAKTIAAGGGAVTITYHQGAAEADDVAREIRNFGGVCNSLQYTVDAPDELPFDLTQYNQIYYFATPKILRGRTALEAEKLAALYNKFYVIGFQLICQAMIDKHIKCNIFYPSTSFIEEPAEGFEQYVQAKLKAEALCDTLNQQSMLKVFSIRLPRLATDQNQSFSATDLASPTEIMLQHIRAMSR
jgi:hypothetical protein